MFISLVHFWPPPIFNSDSYERTTADAYSLVKIRELVRADSKFVYPQMSDPVTSLS